MKSILSPTRIPAVVLVVFVAVALLFSACEKSMAPVEPLDSKQLASGPGAAIGSLGKGPVVQSVSGSGSFIVPGPNDRRTFSFTARRYADGSVEGDWERIRRGPGNAKETKSHGKVLCFTIVGNQAWIGGFATSGLFSTPGENEGGWRVVDNGEGKNALPDQMSLEFVGAATGFAEDYCANTPAAPALFTLEAGNIQIRP